MRLKLIACKALTRELSYLTAVSKNNVDITFMRQGYHNAPEVMREKLQAEIDAVEGSEDPHTNEIGDNENKTSPYVDESFDAILLGYGLCSNGIAGLKSRRYPIVIPRGHDCITFFLGSKERYLEYFSEKLPGCFWYTASWIDNAQMPSQRSYEREIEFYHEKGYDDDDIEFLLENNHEWIGKYENAAYIKMPFFDKPYYSEFTKAAAEYQKWGYACVEGDMSLLERFVSGDWNEEDFLVVPPGNTIKPSYDEKIITY